MQVEPSHALQAAEKQKHDLVPASVLGAKSGPPQPPVAR